MSALNPREVEQLCKFINLLGSDKEGEVMAAARMGTRFLAERSLSWCDVTAMLKPLLAVVRPKPEPRQPSRPASAELLRPHQREAWLLLVSGFAWDDWKKNFLSDIRHRRRELTEAQADKLRECRRLVNDWRDWRETAA
jgi:hypothetical protein